MLALALLALFAGAAVLGFGYSLIRIALGEELSLAEVTAQASLGILFSYLFWYFLRALAQRRAVEEMARDQDIPGNAKVRHYEALISLVAVSLRLRTPYLIGKRDRDVGGLLLCQLLTLLGGWWSIPMGPVDTVRTLWTNQRGGYRNCASEIAAPPSEES